MADDSPHPDAAKIEAMARAAITSLGGDPDARIGHGWYEAWDPHKSSLPADPTGGAVPLGLVRSPQWMLSTRSALRTLAMMRAAGEHDGI